MAVGGITYYIKKSSSITPQNTQENNYQPATNQNSALNIPVVNSSTSTKKNNTIIPAPITILALTIKDSKKTFTITKKQIITVTLCNPGDSGYQFDTPKYDSSVLSLTNHINIPINNPTGYVGGCYGNDVFKFQASNVGSSKLVVTASRGTANILNMFSATIVVQD